MTQPLAKPFSPKLIMQVMAVLIVCLSLVAGYYYTAHDNQLKKYARLEDRYVRVRAMLGREETQRLIDRSYESDPPQHQEDW